MDSRSELNVEIESLMQQMDIHELEKLLDFVLALASHKEAA
jgi:hypothetical protein